MMTSTSIKEPATHVLIRSWIEVPPKWDVVSIDDVIGKLRPGETCHVKYDHIKTPYATILRLGTESSLRRELEEIRSEDEAEEAPEFKMPSKRKNQQQGGGHLGSPSETRLADKVLTLEARVAYLEKEIEMLREEKSPVAAAAVTPATSRERRAAVRRLSATQSHVECSSSTSVVSSSGMDAISMFPSKTIAVGFSEESHLFQQNEMVTIGPNTKVTAAQYKRIDWTKGRLAVRELCLVVFGRDVLQTHSLTGKARGDKGSEQLSKPKLDPGKVADIVEFSTAKTSLTTIEVKRAITSKCNDTRQLTKPIKDEPVI